MAGSNQSQPAKAPDLTSLTPLITALATAYGAWKLFEPKLERIRAIRTEIGKLDWSFRYHYELPQRLLILISTLAVVFLGLAFFDSFRPSFLTAYLPTDAVKAVLSPDNIIWIIVTGGALAAAVYWNFVPRALMGLSWLLATLPIPGLQNLFGPNGRDLGWLQTAVVCEGPDKGAPLMIDDEAVDRVAWALLAKLSQNTGMGDYAAEPANLSASEKANIALFGCIMEANYYAQRWTSPSWSKFYASLADIQRIDPIFAPSQLLAFPNGQAFFEAFRSKLETALEANQLPGPPDRALAAASDMTRAWELLKHKAKGDVLKLIPPFISVLGGRTAWLDRRLRGFPQLNSDGMRPQLIKLLTRWKTLDGGGGIFIQPFSKQQAWLLFHLGALRALPDMKEITFHGTSQVAIARVAALRVIHRVSGLLNAGSSAEAIAVAARLGTSEWTRLETSDFILWGWGREMSKTAQGESWDKAKWHWKFEDDRIQRQ